MRLGLIAVGIGGFFLYDWYNKTANYAAASAVVTNVTTNCYLYKKRFKRRTTTNEAPCPVIKQIAETNPDYEGFEIRERTWVEYRYDVDGLQHTSKHQQKKHKDGKEIAVGDTIKVLVSKTDPKKTRAE